MQAQLFGEQRRLSSIFCSQPAPTVATRLARERRFSALAQELIEEIKDKQERIQELRQEIGDDEGALMNAEADELDLEADEGEEVIFDAVAPMLEEDLNYTRYENEAEIRTIEEEIEELEAKLKCPSL